MWDGVADLLALPTDGQDQGAGLGEVSQINCLWFLGEEAGLVYDQRITNKDLKTKDITSRQNGHLYPNPLTKDFLFPR